MSLVVLSNRLPYALTRQDDGSFSVEPGSGGLVTALRPILQDRGGRWIGWAGVPTDQLGDAKHVFARAGRHYGYELVPVPLSAAERDDFYQGFSNEVVWPLFHDMPSECRFLPRYWHAYEAVNRRFAEVTAGCSGAGDFVWIHDYHLMLVARELRGAGHGARTGFFLHIPFPPLDLFLRLPWRFPILMGLLEHDLIGFQTPRDRRNFLECIRRLVPDAVVGGKGDVRTVQLADRTVRVGAFPIAIDAAEFEARGRGREAVEALQALRADEPNRRIILGIDRLDYTKGIPEKLESFRALLRSQPDLHGAVTLLQIVVPSREEIPGYQDQKVAIERLVGEINWQFTRAGWVPIHYIYRSLAGPELSAYYLAADVALVTPLKDGMNLVCKEYCATRADEDGVLLLSEFAGAAGELQHGALLVNPYDTEGVAETIRRALEMPRAARRSRMRRLRRAVFENDIYRWVDRFLEAAIARDLHDFPVVEEYLPEAARP
jgi:trehalose 6-phosphate synthase/phosphatase